MTRVSAFIQARMGSSRLPGKVLKEINGIPVILHIVMRLKQSRYIDNIVLLTSFNKENDELVELAKHHNINVFRGSEENVLERFQQASQAFPSEHIIRITGDSPFVDAGICDLLLQAYFNKQVDYAFLSERFAEGVDCEVFSSSILAALDASVLRASEREHVTLHFYENKRKQFFTYEMENITDDSLYRFTLDTLEDWLVIKELARFTDDTVNINYQCIKELMDAQPYIKEINSKVVRNEGLVISLQNEEQ
ncbi:glycosyltransferase family protein [Marinomonas sp. 15G1-11]|uniref:Glycosyltransferase family protein n=1 Tax=Marinomonas phaeophyticola TaxID=3004091 RepID=A0ABT4JSJ0_9GAMM|nr:glycosyltransferase family protein [Marinomonas sp. 15G1-11]MCZ2721215.1 glycosyltransferase family protein [Marinomonas sp. 15G1-11]